MAERNQEIFDLPFYNQDLDEPGQQHQAWQDFRAQIQACDGLLFVMPEYNRGVRALDRATGAIRSQ